MTLGSDCDWDTRREGSPELAAGSWQDWRDEERTLRYFPLPTVLLMP